MLDKQIEDIQGFTLKTESQFVPIPVVVAAERDRIDLIVQLVRLTGIITAEIDVDIRQLNPDLTEVSATNRNLAVIEL